VALDIAGLVDIAGIGTIAWLVGMALLVLFNDVLDELNKEERDWPCSCNVAWLPMRLAGGGGDALWQSRLLPEAEISGALLRPSRVCTGGGGALRASPLFSTDTMASILADLCGGGRCGGGGAEQLILDAFILALPGEMILLFPP